MTSDIESYYEMDVEDARLRIGSGKL